MSIETDVTPGSMGTMAYEPPASTPTVSNQTSESSSSGSNTSNWASKMLKVFQNVYEVDTEDVLERCKISLNPLVTTPFLTNGLLEGEYSNTPELILNGKRPDMWGPVWIFFTLVFSIFFSASVTELFNLEVDKFDYSQLLIVITTVLYSFSFFIPILIWTLIQYFELVPSLTLIQFLSLYGYSFTTWIPAALLAGFSLDLGLLGTVIRLLSIVVAFLMSSAFVYGNLYKIMAAHASQAVSINKSRMTIVLFLGIVTQASLAFFVFFWISKSTKEIKSD